MESLEIDWGSKKKTKTKTKDIFLMYVFFCWLFFMASETKNALQTSKSC